MKKFLMIFCACIVLTIASMAGLLYVTANQNYPPLEDGDLIFQTHISNQSSAILFATASPFTHMGMIKKKGADIVVVEAAGDVGETPFNTWVSRGVLGRVAIYRDPSMTPKDAQRILAHAKTLYGKSYDIFFSLKNDKYYCSEVPYVSYQSAGLSIGKVQKISSLNMNNAAVKKLVEQRWERYPDCKARKYNFEQCYQYILDQDIITPASIAEDDQLQKIYSSYPF